MSNERIITQREVARMLRVHPNTVRRMTKRGMPAIRVGRTVRYLPSDVLGYLTHGRRRGR